MARRFAAVLFSLATSACATSGAVRPVAVLTDAGGCRLEQLTDAGDDDGHFQFHGPSRDGRWLVVGTFRGNAEGAYLLNLQTRARRDLTGFTNAGAFSPDGTRVLIANRGADRNRELIDLTLAANTTRTVAPSPQAEFLGTWSRDGRAVLFNSYRTGASDIYVLRAGSTEPRRLTRFEGYDAHADFSPDAHAIVFHREVTKGDYDIVELDLATGAETTLIGGPGAQAYPAWSPDGRYIAYASDAGHAADENDIFVFDRREHRSVRLTAEPGYNVYPAWSSDGRYLFFNSSRGGKRNVFRMRMSTPVTCVILRLSAGA